MTWTNFFTCESIRNFLCFRREEVSGEAQRVLRTFSTSSLEKEDPKPMPSFPDMVAYVQEKVTVCFLFSWREFIHITRWYPLPESANILMSLFYCNFRQLSGSRLQLNILLGLPLFLSTHQHLAR